MWSVACSSLQNTLSELRSYQRQHTLWLQQQEKLLREQAELETKIESRLNYEEQKIRESADGKGETRRPVSRALVGQIILLG